MIMRPEGSRDLSRLASDSSVSVWPATVVHRALVVAVRAHLEMASESGRPTLPDVREHATLLGAELVLSLERAAMIANDRADVEQRPPGICRASPHLLGPKLGSRSRGLGAFSINLVDART